MGKLNILVHNVQRRRWGWEIEGLAPALLAAFLICPDPQMCRRRELGLSFRVTFWIVTVFLYGFLLSYSISIVLSARFDRKLRKEGAS